MTWARSVVIIAVNQGNEAVLWNNIKVDFERVIGEIKPFHAINNAPIFSPTDLFHYLGEAGIPYSRLHDTGGFWGGGGKYVDIENIFPDFDADPENPDSYQFEFTDNLLERICVQGTEPSFRLGASIENEHFRRAFHIFPPKDPKKWARTCEGIINHYNHGWANGYHFDITYWEIWNEPDNQPNPDNSPMWKATKFRLIDGLNGLVETEFTANDIFVIPPEKIAILEYVHI